MAEYKNIKGFTVQTLATDTIASQAAGGTWASGGDLNNGRGNGGGTGTQTAALYFGGDPVGSNGAYNEEYNGTSWTEKADLNTGRGNNLGGAGTTTAALGFGGYGPSSTLANK